MYNNNEHHDGYYFELDARKLPERRKKYSEELSDKVMANWKRQDEQQQAINEVLIQNELS